jgi:hypothetical protein
MSIGDRGLEEFLVEYYLYGVRNCVVDCTCKSSMVLSTVLRGHRFGILPPTRNQYVLQQSHEMGFHEKYLLVKSSPISLWGCFVTIRGPISRLITQFIVNLAYSRRG